MNDQEMAATGKLRSLIIRESHLMIKDDFLSDELLLCFLRARKNDLNRALRLFKNYWKMSRNYPNLLTNLRQSDVQKILNFRYHLVSPLRDPKNGCRVFLIRATHWDIKDCTLEEVFRSLVFCFQQMASEEETQCRGLIIVADMKDVGLHQVRHLTSAITKVLADLLNDVFPLRFQGIHFVFEPWVFKIILSMIWPFLSNKIRSRMFFHGYSMESLHQQVDPTCLPSDYGGWLGPVGNLHFADVFSDKDRSTIFQSFD